MGNCCTTPVKTDVQGTSPSKKRVQTWRATGMIILRDAKLKAFPPFVGEVGDKARVLDASNNSIQSLPPALCVSLVSLERLIVPRNALASLPAEIGSLTRLRILTLDSNALTSLPDALASLTALEELSVANNQLTALNLPPTLQRLKRLEVSGNMALKALPDTLGALDNLEEIKASSCGIQEVTPALSSLQRLKILDLRSNAIKAFPSAVLRGCGALHCLLLQSNPITIYHLEDTEGYGEFEARRKQAADKMIGKTGYWSDMMREPADRPKEP